MSQFNIGGPRAALQSFMSQDCVEWLWVESPLIKILEMLLLMIPKGKSSHWTIVRTPSTRCSVSASAAKLLLPHLLYQIRSKSALKPGR
ncbi:hypothetical protein PoB_003285300 [Plakobranchus ocellatus]|uniref:Uncharacterized protein n=1 Tax=Plakobranchus ocellatus TaxID=259542 RepID=A0AAV4AHS8_9GAST|nr:hypothetical protein PoB_003285300 [Plakobranchus ocellatus]